MGDVTKSSFEYGEECMKGMWSSDKSDLDADR